MIRTLATLLLVLAAVPVAAQTQQEVLQARYDRALAAGYKALMVCGAIGNADPTGLRRSAGSVEAWELAGIQPPLDAVVKELPARVESGTDRFLDYVAVMGR